MKIKRSKTSLNVSWITVFVLLVVLYSSYFLMFIPRQELMVKKRGFRILEEYVGNMYKKLDYYQTHVSNYSLYYVLKSEAKLSDAFEDSSDLQLDQINDVIDKLEKDIVFYADSSPASSTYLVQNGISYLEIPIDTSTTIQLRESKLKEGILKGNALVPFDALMENLQFDRLFQNIALLDENGVIHNSNGSVVHGISNFKALKDTLSKSQGGLFTELELQGVKMHVMVLPINFLNEEFCLAGMITDKDFRAKTRTINSQFLTLFSGILLLLLIGMPILKIIFIDHKERLNVKDAHNTTMSFILGASMMTLLVFGIVKNYLIDSYHFEERIQAISDTLTGNINGDLQRIYNLADVVISEIDEENSSMWNHFSNDTMYKNDPEIYHDSITFNEILFLNEDGKATKAVTRTAFSNLIQLDLSKRNYFKSLTDESELAWPWKDSNKGRFEKFYIESIKSYNTGAKETAISFKLNQPLDSGTHKIPYLAITSHIPSFYDQVLPKDVAFMVIDRKGLVMFHSNQSKILQENFLIECNQSPRMLGGLEYRTVEEARIHYNEQQWLARIVPLKDVPLFHVTLINLQYNENKNTRLYLFTFYFILFTFLTILIGMQIIQRFGNPRKFMKSGNWTFEFLLFNKSKIHAFRFLMVLQGVLVSLQILLSIPFNQPVSVLFVQLILITFSGFIAYFLLKDNPMKHLTVVLFALIVLVIGMVTLSGFMKYYTAGLLLAVVVTCTAAARRYQPKEKSENTEPESTKPRTIYLTYMFIWFMGLAPVPVMVSYFTINNQEKKLTQKAEMINLAKQNLVLENTHHEHHDEESQKMVNGSGIDGYQVENVHSDSVGQTMLKNVDSLRLNISNTMSRTDSGLYRFYSKLRSPLTNDDYLMALLPPVNKTADWVSNDSLYYSAPSQKGEILVYRDQSQKSDKWFIPFLLYLTPLFILILVLWYTFVYLADLVLGALAGKWKYPTIPDWENVVSQNHKRIMLIVFDGEKYWNPVSNQFEKVLADDILEKEDFVQKKLVGMNQIWISGLGEYLLQRQKAEIILTRLKELLNDPDKKIIMELPYDLDFVQEHFDDQVILFDKAQDELLIDEYISELKFLFRQFFRYTGSVDKEKIEKDLCALTGKSRQSLNTEEQILAEAHLMKFKYSHIWNNLNKMEKLILFDLADDGMMNFKNRFLLNRLKMKGLIELHPLPQIFTPSFQYFLKYSVNKDETNILEQRLSKQGKWKNTRYLILFLLVPLGAFLFISQGFSIEKVVAILTGVIALFSGTMRLMDTSWFSNTSKTSS